MDKKQKKEKLRFTRETLRNLDLETVVGGRKAKTSGYSDPKVNCYCSKCGDCISAPPPTESFI